MAGPRLSLTQLLSLNSLHTRNLRRSYEQWFPVAGCGQWFKQILNPLQETQFKFSSFVVCVVEKASILIIIIISKQHEETIDHLTSGSPILTKNEYLMRHDKVCTHTTQYAKP